MYLPDKFPTDKTMTKVLFQRFDNLTDYNYSIGCLYRKGYKETKFCNRAYCCLYVISGTGVYIDTTSKKEYKVTPGCIIQRLPDTEHISIIDENSEWSEFYFAGSKKLFYTLAELGQITDEPVFYIGESEEIHNRLIKYAETIENAIPINENKIISEFVRTLTYINSLKNNTDYTSWAYNVIKVIQQNLSVGIPLEEIAQKCNMSYENLRKKFRKVFGCSIKDYIIEQRITAAKSMLINENLSINEVAFKLGYCDSFALCKQFRTKTGIYPAKFVSEYKINGDYYEK